MRSPSFRALLLAAAIALGASACGSVIDAHHDAGSTGSGGASSTSSTASTGAGGAPSFCGGKAGLQCGPGEFCHFEASSPCGNFDVEGSCEPRPEVCDPDCPGVCGCDGKFYCNACGAELAGFDVSGESACMGPDAYEAVSLDTNVPRFAILKASPLRNLCFRVMVVAESGGSGIPGISGSGVTVESALVTHDAADCQLSGAPVPMPAGATYPAVSGNGTVSLAMSSSGCVAAIHAKVVFSGEPPWAPPSELLDADDLSILGGCP